MNLHGYYTGLETLYERVARLLDQAVSAGPSWHVELIEQMRTEVPGLRPALVPSEVLGDLHELRKFRHFFRNAYVLKLDPVRIREHAERLLRVHGALAAIFESFASHLDGIVGSLRE